MITTAQDWIKETLSIMGLSNVTFITNPNGPYLNIWFEQPLADDPRQEELLLKSWGNLLHDFMRSKFENDARSVRVSFERKN